MVAGRVKFVCANSRVTRVSPYFVLYITHAGCKIGETPHLAPASKKILNLIGGQLVSQIFINKKSKSIPRRLRHVWKRWNNDSFLIKVLMLVRVPMWCLIYFVPRVVTYLNVASLRLHSSSGSKKTALCFPSGILNKKTARRYRYVRQQGKSQKMK